MPRSKGPKGPPISRPTSRPSPAHGEILRTAFAAFSAGRFSEAERLCRKILKADPRQADALNLRGLVAATQGDASKALDFFQRLMRLKPNDPAALINYANVLRELGQLEQALTSYARALDLNDRLADAYLNRGLTLHRLERRKQAIADFDRALALNADDAEAWNNRGAVLDDWGRYDEAIQAFERALTIKPNLADAYVNLGNSLTSLEKHDLAFECFKKASDIQPRSADAQLGMGAVLDRLDRTDLSESYYQRAVKLQPGSSQVLARAGRALVTNNNPIKALPYLERAVKLAPGLKNTLSAYLHAKMQLSDWDGLAPLVKRLEKHLRDGIAEVPLYVLALLDDPELQMLAARASTPPDSPETPSPWTLTTQPGERVRIAYFSPDFRNHAVSFLAAELFELHDRARFEVFGFWFGRDSSDAMRARLSSAFDHFIDIRDRSDQGVVDLCKQHRITIAIDLAGHTQDARPGIFAQRCAPIQLTYLGYAGTTGLANMDYIVADETVIPEDDSCYFTEKPLFLPGSFQVNDSTREISEGTQHRAEHGLPESGLVFCCFNRGFKITPEVFATWMQILASTEPSVLWLAVRDPVQQQNLRNKARHYQVSPERLIFAGRTASLADHLARHRLADLFLDTFPYTAHTTASDALWAGLPIVTCKGRSFVSRVSASLLAALALDELVASSLDEYAQIAIRLARDEKALRSVKERLAVGRVQSPLFKASEFARALERGFLETLTRAEAGLPPKTIRISADQPPDL